MTVTQIAADRRNNGASPSTTCHYPLVNPHTLVLSSVSVRMCLCPCLQLLKWLTEWLRNVEPRLRMVGLHYLGCFCSQPVLFICSPLRHIFHIRLLCAACEGGDGWIWASACLEVICVHCFHPLRRNNTAKVVSILLISNGQQFVSFEPKCWENCVKSVSISTVYNILTKHSNNLV